MASNFPQKLVEVVDQNLNQTHSSAGNSFIHWSENSNTHGQSTVYTVYSSTFTQGGMNMSGKNTFAHKVDFQNLSTSCPLHSLKQAFDKWLHEDLISFSSCKNHSDIPSILCDPSEAQDSCCNLCSMMDFTCLNTISLSHFSQRSVAELTGSQTILQSSDAEKWHKLTTKT